MPFIPNNMAENNARKIKRRAPKLWKSVATSEKRVQKKRRKSINNNHKYKVKCCAVLEGAEHFLVDCFCFLGGVKANELGG